MFFDFISVFFSTLAHEKREKQTASIE